MPGRLFRAAGALLSLFHPHRVSRSKNLRRMLPLITLIAWPGELRMQGQAPALLLSNSLQTSVPGIYDEADPSDPEHPAETNRQSPAAESQILSVRTALLLPDLRTLPPSDLQIVLDDDHRRVLRLSNTLWNSGAGPLELAGEFDYRSRLTTVSQHVYTHGGLTLEHFVGEFIWHPTHDHWHFEDFTLYELWAIDGVGNPLQIVSSSDKLSYCVVDTDIIDPNNPAYLPRKRYSGCGRALQGLSAGWGDTYKANLDGQSLDLTGLRDGYYLLRSTTNPTASVLEANYTNNMAFVYIEIRGDRVVVIPPQELSEALCQTNWKC